MTIAIDETMAVPYHVQHILDDPSSFPHHRSVELLWQTLWREPCSLGVYPFVHGKVEDFDPIFQELVARSKNSTTILFEPDAYAEPFFPVARDLTTRAEAAERNGDLTQAQDLFLRASAVYRIARFPVNRKECPLNSEAWTLGKAAYLHGAKYFSSPAQEVPIPFRQADASAGDSLEDIPTILRIPNGHKPSPGWPVIIFICGIDGYRTDVTDFCDKHLNDGFAVLSLEVPGTGDCPGARKDPASPDRVYGSVLDWLGSQDALRYSLDATRVFARGVSTGGYYALRLAYTHKERIIASVMQGGWSHYALEENWLKGSNNGEFPWNIAGAFVYKLGYASVADAVADNILERFSLLRTGILGQDSCKLLLINGMEDSLFPVEDTILAATYGRIKDIRLSQEPHMGWPEGEDVI